MKKELFCFLFFILSQSLFSQTILGIDVAHHQGVINWQLVSADGKVFAYVKATEGMTYTDPKFITNITNGNSAGLIMGAYHFARPDNNTANQDANNFISVANSYIGNGKLPPALDLEDVEGLPTLDSQFSSTELSNWVEQWLVIVENQTGIKPIIYTTSHYANYLNNSLDSYELWIAKPNTSATSPPTNLGIWNDWKIKQYSWEGSVQGISGFTDLNSFNGSTNDFNDFINAGNINTLDCSNAVELTCGISFSGNNSTDSSNISSYGCNSWTETGPERIHTITPSANGTLTATISNFSGDLDVYILGSCNPSDCLGTVSSSSATYSNAQSGQTYYIVVDSDDGSVSSYDIIIDCPTSGSSEDIVFY